MVTSAGEKIRLFCEIVGVATAANAAAAVRANPMVASMVRVTATGPRVEMRLITYRVHP
jgi:hypothetical protein